jgi:uncharacterized membrane protein YfcA
LEPLEVSVLAAAAFATSVLSAVVGMAGGITLLSVMLLFLDPLVAIPLHGAVQLVSNSSRTVIQRRYVERGILLRYAALLLPMSFLGVEFAQLLPASLTRTLIGVFVIAATWAPGLVLLGAHPERAEPTRRFLTLGAVAGFLNPTIGATGPLIAPFFLNLGLDRRALVGTKAACQAAGHLMKLVAFGVAGFAFAAWLVPLVILSGMVVAGTWLGSRILDHVSELWFTRLYRTVLTLIAVRLILKEALELLHLP